MTMLLQGIDGKVYKANPDIDVMFAKDYSAGGVGMYRHESHAIYYMWHDNITNQGYMLEQVELNDVVEKLSGMKIVDEHVLDEIIEDINAAKRK
jgi:hypothetical protein